MEVNDFSIEFDLLFNNVASNKAPGLNEYEKSLFLTEAQEIVTQSLYSGAGGSFETTEEMTAYLSSIVKRNTFTSFKTDKLYGWTTYGVTLPTNVWYITFENGVVDGNPVEVIPVTHDMFLRTVRNPFRGPTAKRALRICRSGGDIIRYSEVIPKKDGKLTEYQIHYVEKPEPIVLEDGIEINGKVYNAQTSKMPECIHRTILMKAVELAKSIWD